MFYTQFKIFKEDDEVLEFNYNQKHLYFNMLIGFIAFAYCVIRWNDSIAFLFAISVGIMFLLLGVVPIFYKKAIIISKIREELRIIIGVRWIYSKEMIVPFTQINHIEIDESSLSSGDFHKDTIYLNIKERNKLKLGTSCSEEYSNKFTYKLSETIGCKVICIK